jgi:hypothetical protein
MTSFKRVVVAAGLMLGCLVLPALAIMPPPAKLLDSKVEPACVTARGSLLPQGGDNSAVSLINKCSFDVVVSGVAERDIKSPEKKVDDIPLVLATRAGGYVQYIDLRLKGAGTDCFAVKAEGSTCKSVTLRPADGLIVPVAWGEHYNIDGQTSDDKGDALHATGWLINANDPLQAMEIIRHESGQR